MYSYYFLRSMKVRVPGPVAKFITTIQIWQFIISVGILAHLGWLVYGRNVHIFLFLTFRRFLRLFFRIY
jgi:hypothetical protein